MQHTDALSSEAELGRRRDGERPSALSEVVVAFTDPCTSPVPDCVSVMVAAEALLEYASGGRTDNDRIGSVGLSRAN